MENTWHQQTFKATEKVDVQFRAEAFNIFNHPQFSQLNSSVGTDFFMRATAAHKQRVVQLALKLSF